MRGWPLERAARWAKSAETLGWLWGRGPEVALQLGAAAVEGARPLLLTLQQQLLMMMMMPMLGMRMTRLLMVALLMLLLRLVASVSAVVPTTA